MNVYLYLYLCECVCLCAIFKCDTFENYRVKWYMVAPERALENKIVFGNRFDDDKKGLRVSVTILIYHITCLSLAMATVITLSLSHSRWNILLLDKFDRKWHIVHTFFFFVSLEPFSCEMLVFSSIFGNIWFSALSQTHERISIFFSSISRTKVTANNSRIQKRKNIVARACVCVWWKRNFTPNYDTLNRNKIPYRMCHLPYFIFKWLCSIKPDALTVNRWGGLT